jgi:hypothetical protein
MALPIVGRVTECDCKHSIMSRPWPASGRCALREKEILPLLLWAAVYLVVVLYLSAIIGHNCDPVVLLSPSALYRPFILVPKFGMNMQILSFATIHVVCLPLTRMEYEVVD